MAKLILKFAGSLHGCNYLTEFGMDVYLHKRNGWNCQAPSFVFHETKSKQFGTRSADGHMLYRWSVASLPAVLTSVTSIQFSPPSLTRWVSFPFWVCMTNSLQVKWLIAYPSSLAIPLQVGLYWRVGFAGFSRRFSLPPICEMFAPIWTCFLI